MTSLVRRVRCRVGRWLLRPDADRIVAYHVRLSTRLHNEGRYRDAGRFDDVALGASYVRDGWPL